MRVLSALGNTAEALLDYEAFRHRLRDDLGVSPGTRLQAVHRGLLTGS
ncbi:BTAD domain-containing putative transcriptional regulator [Saccharothrix sp. ALI-22-I]|nr:BTAD domain-containing putative transcriptional regulator [Saccharothrix sp. ALI-22-I]